MRSSLPTPRPRYFQVPEHERAQTKVLKFVIQQPVGAPGRKAWREMWIVMRPAGGAQFIATFREDGTGSANFEFQGHTQK
jgi:hypothetical protein